MRLVLRCEYMGVSMAGEIDDGFGNYHWSCCALISKLTSTDTKSLSNPSRSRRNPPPGCVRRYIPVLTWREHHLRVERFYLPLTLLADQRVMRLGEPHELAGSSADIVNRAIALHQRVVGSLARVDDNIGDHVTQLAIA